MTGIKKTEHVPVLLNEVLENLKITKNGWYIDGTFGLGGHSREIIKKEGRVLGLDQDKETINKGTVEYRGEIKSGALILEKASFSTLKTVAAKHNIIPKGILLDLGFSSWQLDQSGRGFSFSKNEIMDMRMDPENQGVRACDLVNGLYENELFKLISTYGEDPLAKQIASKIVAKRKTHRIEIATELATLIEDVYKHYYHNKSLKNPATKTFQALRIVVNDEINSLIQGMQSALEVLENKGKLAIITFHGLEDRTVKKTFAAWEKYGRGNLVYKKPIYPSDEEISQNLRSHSAKLRIFNKN